MIAPFITLFINLAWGFSLEKEVGAGAWCVVGSGDSPALAKWLWGNPAPAALDLGGEVMTLLRPLRGELEGGRQC